MSNMNTTTTVLKDAESLPQRTVTSILQRTEKFSRPIRSARRLINIDELYRVCCNSHRSSKQVIVISCRILRRIPPILANKLQAHMVACRFPRLLSAGRAADLRAVGVLIFFPIDKKRERGLRGLFHNASNRR